MRGPRGLFRGVFFVCAPGTAAPLRVDAAAAESVQMGKVLHRRLKAAGAAGALARHVTADHRG